jgi:hypothetical protein
LTGEGGVGVPARANDVHRGALERKIVPVDEIA